MKDWISANGGILTVLGVAIVLLGAYAEWRIAVAVDQKFTDAGSVAPHRMDQAEEDIKDLEAADSKLDDKISRIIDILLED